MKCVNSQTREGEKTAADIANPQSCFGLSLVLALIGYPGMGFLNDHTSSK